MGRMEILTGVERRRGWSDEEKLSILEKAAVTGANIADVARQCDLKPQQIYTWRKKFAAEHADTVVSFLPVALITMEAMASESPTMARVDKNKTEPSAIARPLVTSRNDASGDVLLPGRLQFRLHPPSRDRQRGSRLRPGLVPRHASYPAAQKSIL